MPLSYRSKHHGFTIVELLIVIVVIAVLASITVVAYNGVAMRATVAKVQQDLKSMQKFIELYKADNGAYPASAGNTWSFSSNSSDGFIPGIVPTYTNALPRFTADSVTNGAHAYVYISNGTDYKVIRLCQPSLSAAEAALVPSAMNDQGKLDRYGVWSSAAAAVW